MTAGYAPLWVKSNFSFLEGASHPEQLVEQAQLLGLPALALTDRNGVYGSVRAHVRAQELGLKLVHGAEVTLAATTPSCVVLLCQDRTGYANLCRLLTRGHAHGKKGEAALALEALCELSQGLLALCPQPGPLAQLRESFGDRLYALVVRHLRADEQPRERALREAASALGVRTVAGSEVLYDQPSRQPLADVLACIRAGKPLAQAGHAIRPNAEHYLKGGPSMAELFGDDQVSLRRSLEVAERCRFSFAELRYTYPAERIPSGKTESDWLRELTFAGARERYPDGVPADVAEQLDRELQLIQTLQYGGYFLTMWEIVQFCRQSRILCQGRGSAANSAVCYCLGITAIDPVKLDLLFERFLSLERAEPPDIDLDIEHERREEVIQWVYERYGRRHAAMVANVIRYRLRSAMRDVGKVLGLPQTALERLSKVVGAHGEAVGHETLRSAGLDPEAPVHAHFLSLVEQLQDFPRHLSIHPGGFLLGHEPVDTLVPIEPATMEGRTVIQWDKYSVEDLGLFKVDLLGLGALTQVRKCFELLREHEGLALNMATLPHEDAETYAMISRGDTVGLFQIESRAQMSMLPRLKPRTLYDLVIEVAIVRPGPIQGDMVHPYLRRRNGEEPQEYPHPALERVLKKTLGVPIFQEQVMKIAVLVGGYTPGESDQLRRDMAAWKSSGRIERHHDRLVGRMIDHGIAPDFAERIFSQIRGFGEYGFPESHAASFALIAYVTAWQRCHHPAAFACSLLNAQPMGFYAPATIVEDAKRHGIEVRPIDVRHSAWDCTLEASSVGVSEANLAVGWAPDGFAGRAGPCRLAGMPRARALPGVSGANRAGAVRMGLRYVKGFGAREEQPLKWAPPPYRSLGDFMARTRLSKRAYQNLAEAGALDGLVEGRRNAVWALREVYGRLDDGLQLGAGDTAHPRLRALSDAEEVFWDYRVSQHSTRGHPIASLRSRLDAMGIPTARALTALRDGTRARYVGMTICRQRPGTASGVTFYTLEDETGFVNLVVWTPVFERHAVIARTALLLGVTGKVQSENGVVHLIADSLWEPEMEFEPEGTSTRSFH